MSVLTAPRSVAFTRQLLLPFTRQAQPAIKPMRGSGSPQPLHEDGARGVAKATAPAGDKPGGP